MPGGPRGSARTGSAAGAPPSAERGGRGHRDARSSSARHPRWRRGRDPSAVRSRRPPRRPPRLRPFGWRRSPGARWSVPGRPAVRRSRRVGWSCSNECDLCLSRRQPGAPGGNHTGPRRTTSTGARRTSEAGPRSVDPNRITDMQAAPLDRRLSIGLRVRRLVAGDSLRILSIGSARPSTCRSVPAADSGRSSAAGHARRAGSAS